MGKKIWLDKDIKNFVDGTKYKLVSNYVVDHTMKLILIDNENYYYFGNFNNFLKNRSFSRFEISNPYTLQNIKLWCKINNKPFELLSNKYEGNRKKLIWKCLKDNCGEIFEMSWDKTYRNQSCQYCLGQQVGISNCLATKRPDLAIEWYVNKNGLLTPYDVTCWSDKYVWWKCKECGYEWVTRVKNRGNGKGCPECNKSKGEKKIKEYLELTNISFESQKEYENLVGLGNGNLSYDFYLPDNNLLIEYQGEQHEKFTKGFHKSKNDFEKQQEHDRRKKEYAYIHDIKLLEIWYWDFDRIEEILKEVRK